MDSGKQQHIHYSITSFYLQQDSNRRQTETTLTRKKTEMLFKCLKWPVLFLPYVLIIMLLASQNQETTFHFLFPSISQHALLLSMTTIFP